MIVDVGFSDFHTYKNLEKCIKIGERFITCALRLSSLFFERGYVGNEVSS